MYGSLTTALAARYLAAVVILQAAFRALAGQESDLAMVLSTLGIATIFRPLRRSIQAGVDRRFYRRRYDATLTLSRFAATLRDQVDLNEPASRLVAVVEESMHPAHVSLWLGRPGP